MYHALLTNRYLTTRIIPFIAVAAVALCVALVIIVVSVMTGFLNMVKSSGRTLMGDVVISYPVSGIPHYDQLIATLSALPEVEAATPVVDSWGLLKMPYPSGPNKETETVQVWAVEPESFAKVTGYGDILYWKPPSSEEASHMKPIDPRLDDPNMLQQMLANGRALRNLKQDRPGIALGMHISAANERQSDGSYRYLGQWWMPHYDVTLTVIPVLGGANIQPESAILPVVNEFISGVYLIDDKRVIIPLELGQKMLHLNEAQRASTELGPDHMPLPGGIDPARATMVLVRAKDGVSADDLKKVVMSGYDTFYANLKRAEVSPPRRGENGPGATIQTWAEQQAAFIGPIEKERELMRTLFSLVYVVCAGLILSIFWAIVYEKTRDIGILRSVGASRIGIVYIFLRYGLVIGVIGAIAGLGLGWLIVRYINVIHTALGQPPKWLPWILGGLTVAALAATLILIRSQRLMPVVLGAMLTALAATLAAGAWLIVRAGGIVIWDPSVYYFTQIPNHVDYATALTTMIGAVVFSLVGAILPAAKAADTDPVRALRYE